MGIERMTPEEIEEYRAEQAALDPIDCMLGEHEFKYHKETDSITCKYCKRMWMRVTVVVGR